MQFWRIAFKMIRIQVRREIAFFKRIDSQKLKQLTPTAMSFSHRLVIRLNYHQINYHAIENFSLTLITLLFPVFF